MLKELMGALLLALSTTAVCAAPPQIEASLVGTKQLIVQFAQPMQTWANEVREDVVRIDAPHATRCRWDSDMRLACSIEPALRLATSYRVDVAPGLLTQTGRPLPGRRLSVETTRPSVAARITDWKAGVPEIELAATMPLLDASLADALRLELDGRAVPMTPVRPLPPEWDGDARHRYALDLPPIEGHDHVLTLRIEPGLRAAEGPLPGQQSQALLRARIAPAFVLRGMECRQRSGVVRTTTTANTVTTSCLAGEVVGLAFSEPLDATSRQRIVDRFAQVARLDVAAVKQLADQTKHWRKAFGEDGVAHPAGEWLDLGPLEPTAPFELTLAGVRSQSGATLAPVMIRIATIDSQPQLRARYHHTLVADGRHPPAQLQAINAGTQELEVAGVGAQARAEGVHVRAPRNGGIPQAIESQVASQVLAEGGWVRWQLPGTDEAVQFAAPGFDLLAVSGQREVLAWANAWDRDEPVAGVEIELLWSTDDAPPRVVARARTGADGTALLKLPDDIAVVEPDDDSRWSWEGPRWMLRAARDDTRAVLPLGPTGWGMHLGRPVPRKFWGVSDRPLYRAGDVVHYRLWQRELHGTRLRAPKANAPVRLRLQNQENEKVVLEWDATTTAGGDIAGELALPIHLTDATYCIGVPKGSYNTDGTCFFVGTYRAQDLWADVKSSGGVLRDGDRFSATVSAGYFSGGPAGGAELERVFVSLQPEPLESAYPAFDDYTFIEVEDDDTEYAVLAGIEDVPQLDDNGARRIDVPVAFMGSSEDIEHRPAFARIVTELEVSPEGREGTTASEQATCYARYDRYVGLKATPDWFDADDKVALEAVVITADGKEVDMRDVEVDVERVTGWGASERIERVGRCVIRTRVSTPCDFARASSGRYRITARAQRAAPARLERYVWTGGGVHWEGEGEEAELTVLDVAERDESARVLLKQPFERARALFVVSLGGQLLHHRVEAIAGNVKDVALALAPEWRGSQLNVAAYVRESGPTRVADGYRTPARVVEASESLSFVAADPLPLPLSLRFQPAQSTPGSRAQVMLRNDGARPLDVTLSIMDDALRAQAQRWLPYADPHGPASFAILTERGQGGTSEAGFDGWNDDAWRWLLPWPEEDERDEDGTLAEVPPPPSQPEPKHQVADASAVDTPESTTLDRIEVTGSRIKKADIIETNDRKAPDPNLRLDRDRDASASPFVSSPQRVRMQFVDTALWEPAIRLMPGESRTIDVSLPDNLTRWRAVAWASDGGHEFTMTEAALEVGLPVEARLQSPVRLYPGDTSQVATNVRHVAPTATTARTLLQVHGNEGESFDDAHTLGLSARGQGSVETTLTPQAPGQLELVARAKTDAGEDAVGASIEIASPLIPARKLQAGWIGDGGLRLDLPTLPGGATEPQLQVSLLRGTQGLEEGWTHDLHVYPHRCWEQILSRAVGAALALSRHDESWPDAALVVKEALDNAAVFQNEDGGFFYFPLPDDEPDSHVVLSAYTVRAFALLRSLGHPVPEGIDARAREFLAEVEAPNAEEEIEDGDEVELAHFAYAAAAKTPEEKAGLDALWARWDRTPLPGQVATARALADGSHPAATRAVKRLLQQAPLRGATRSFRLQGRYDYWMSSELREQCALIELLRDHPRLAPANVRTQLLAGIADLYAGGAPYVDTQTAATCLMALHDPSGGVDGAASASFALGPRTQELSLAQGENRKDWNAGAPDAPQLRIETRAPDVPLSFIAELAYVEDARTAQASAVGFAIERRYEVLRDGTWKPVERETLREGDWIRVTLAVESSMQREFVAVTDSVPGGLRPTDLELSAVATSELERVGDEGSYAFATRKLDARNPRFYAESLAPGRHELHYFARVGNTGDYLAAPATAELMYGNATYARTAATRIRIEATPAD